MRRSILMIPAIILFMAGCKKDDNNQNPGNNTPAQSFPFLKKGNRWLYDFNYNNTVADSLTVEITSEQDGVFETTTKDSHTEEKGYLFADGIYLKQYSPGGDKSKAVVMMKAGAGVGESWTKPDGSDSITVTVKEVNVPVATPAGTFNCRHVESKYKKSGTVMQVYSTDADYIIKIEIDSKTNYTLRSKNF